MKNIIIKHHLFYLGTILGAILYHILMLHSNLHINLKSYIALSCLIFDAICIYYSASRSFKINSIGYITMISFPYLVFTFLSPFSWNKIAVVSVIAIVSSFAFDFIKDKQILKRYITIRCILVYILIVALIAHPLIQKNLMREHEEDIMHNSAIIVHT